MKEMAYRAYDAGGTLLTGTTQGENEQDIITLMRKKGLFVVDLETSRSRTFFESLMQLRWFNRVKIEELIIFTRQFYTLFKAGLGVDVLLGTLIKQSTNETLRETLRIVQEDVQQGMGLAKAFAKHPATFDKLYTSMLLAGEEAGILEEALEELNKVLEKEHKLRQEIKSATLYPKIVVGVMGMSLYSMLTFVIPRFSTFYDQFQAKLPLPTRLMIGMSYFASHYWYLALILIFTTAFLLHRYLRTPTGRLRCDLLKLRVPILGKLYQKISMARFGHIFSALYRSGLPLVRSFEVLSGIIGNEAYALEINKFREGILKGKTISDVMRNSQLFPIILIETTAIGEQSGNLDNMLSSIANHFDLEVSHMTKNLTTMIEPILLCFMFGMVTLMALGIYLPMWNLSQVVK